jgi:hypothetical protein
LLIALACAVVPAHAQDTPDDPQCVPQDDSNKKTDTQYPHCDTKQRAIPYDPQTA